MFAKIVAPGFSYQLTPTDILWAGRMADGERDADAKLVLWTMAQRFAGLQRRGSFTRFIQAYSQPINPKWRRDGVCCAQGATGCPARRSRNFYGEDDCSPRRLANRDRFASLPWDQLPAGVRRDVLAWAKAKVPNPAPHAVDFAAKSLVQRKMTRNDTLKLVAKGKLVGRSQNWFISNSASRAWSRNHVTLQLDGRVAGAASRTSPLVLLVGAAALGVVGAKAIRRLRG
jgi:hypothetical protein